MKPALLAPMLALLWICCATTLQRRDGASSPLPSPTGSYEMGTRLLAPQVDPSRRDDRFARGALTVLVQLWYPAARQGAERSHYFAEPELLDAIKAESSAPELVERWRVLRTHATMDAPPAPGHFPLVLFSPGFGMARAFYTSWIEELASRGYVVAAVGTSHAPRRTLLASRASNTVGGIPPSGHDHRSSRIRRLPH